MEGNTERFDDAAFERAFDAAGADILEQYEHNQGFEQVELGQDVLIDECGVNRHQLDAQYLGPLEAEQLVQSSNIPSMTIPQTNHLAAEAELERVQQLAVVLEDAMQDEEEAYQQQRMNDGDELATTAARLLDSVAHDTSQKFQESQFLALMRRLRDREVRVEGDQMVDVSSSPLTPSSAALPFENEQRHRHKHSYDPSHDSITCKVFSCDAP